MHPPKMGGKQENAGHQQQDLTGKFLGVLAPQGAFAKHKDHSRCRVLRLVWPSARTPQMREDGSSKLTRGELSGVDDNLTDA